MIRLFATTAVLVLAVCTTTWAQFTDKVLIEGAKIIPVVGDVIEKGNILIENGKIVAVGVDVKAPFDAKVIDASGKTVFPGMIDPYTSSGLDIPNESVPVASFVRVADAIDPSARYFENALRGGLTSIHIAQGANAVISGVTRVVRPIGMMVSEITVEAEGGLGIVFSAAGGRDVAGQLATLRGTFRSFDRYLKRLAEKLYEEEQKKDGGEVRVGPKEARKLGAKLIKPSKIEDRYRNLWRIRHGELDVYAHCSRAMDVQTALDFAKAQGFADNMTIVLGSETFKAVRRLKKLSRPVILSKSQFVHREADRMTQEPIDTFVPDVLMKNGIEFAIAGSEEPWYEAARLVRNGIPRQKALEAITLNAAKAIGLGARLGSIEPGKDGNILILSGDPLDTMTWVEHVFIEGRHVYDNKKDLRLRHLLQGAFDTKLAADKKSAAALEAKNARADKEAKAKTDEKSKASKGDKPAKSDEKSKADSKPSDAKKSPAPAGGSKN